MNSEIFIFSFGAVVTALIGAPLTYAIILKNRVNRRQERLSYIRKRREHEEDPHSASPSHSPA